MECEQPAWVPDSQASRCALCTKEFGIIKTRHHCRACGNVFCDPCSTNSIPLPQFGLMGPQRVCNTCFTYQTKRYQYHITYVELITKGQAMWAYERTRKLESHLQLSKNGKQFVIRVPSITIPVASIIQARKGLHASSRASSFCCFGGQEVDEDRCFHVVYGSGQSISFELLSSDLANFWCAAVAKAAEHLISPEPSNQARQKAFGANSPPPSSSTKSATSSPSSAILVENDRSGTAEASAEENDRIARRKMMEAQRDAIRKKYRLESMDS
eukprot:TRINITY_DN7279_c1_g1_i1.p1 TRINITY_DN7279_c1_g1~~TRINITY_DN7279_c1_g1_i1.p1  ORF type:complete len:271 (+),score=44.78 TRINITY_DN7279_c1_g1_i1:46-858(+)